MFDYISLLKNKLFEIFSKVFHEQILRMPNLDLEKLKDLVELEVPKKREFGDLSSNLALIFCKILEMPTKEIALQILCSIHEDEFFISEFKIVEIASNGFLNFTFKDSSLIKILDKILKNGQNYGSSCQIGVKKNVNLEFCSANPTGPVHLGHIRGAIWGMVVSNLLKFCGFDVCNEFYINDGGGQIEILVKTTFLRYLEIFPDFIGKIQIPEGFYPGEYIRQIAQKMKKEFGNKFLIGQNFKPDDQNFLEKIDNFLNSEPEFFETIRRFVLDQILFMIKEDLAFFGVEFDIFSSETKIVFGQDCKLLKETLEIFEKQNLLYFGKLQKPKANENEDWEEKEQLLFKSSEFGDDSDRAMKRSSGEWTYFAKDCAYHLDKLKRNFDRLILEVGVDHIGYKKRLSAAVCALSKGICKEKNIKFDFEFHNMVYIKKNDQQFKMSKRSGNLIGAEFLKENLGKDITIFYLLSKKHEMELDFDIEKAQETSTNNPYFYIQYANTRANSILRNFKNDHPEAFDEFEKFDLWNLACENHEFSKNFEISAHEKEILLHLILFPQMIKNAALKLQPHRINFYLSDLASKIHSWWNEGISNPESRILLEIKNNKQKKHKTFFRISILKALMQIVKSGLKLLNIEALEKM